MDLEYKFSVSNLKQNNARLSDQLQENTETLLHDIRDPDCERVLILCDRSCHCPLTPAEHSQVDRLSSVTLVHWRQWSAQTPTHGHWSVEKLFPRIINTIFASFCGA